MARIFSLQVGSPVGVDALLQQFIASVLSDYSEVAPEDIVDTSYELVKAGFTMHDFTHNADPDHRGILICRSDGDNVAAIAFMKIPRELSGGVAVDIFSTTRKTGLIPLR